MALACIVAGLGGLMQFQEGKRIKAVEGIPVDEAEMLGDVERGVVDREDEEGKEKEKESKGSGKKKLEKRKKGEKDGGEVGR